MFSAFRGSRCLVVACLRRAITFPSPPQTSPTRDFALKGPNLRIQRHGKVFPDWTHKGTQVGTGYNRRWVQLSGEVLRPRDKATESFLSPGPEFSFDLLPEARAIRVNIPSGPEVSVRLCHQWALECEELSSPYDVQVWRVIPCKKPDHTVLATEATHCTHGGN